jgi:hypothetical protein
MKKGLLLTVSVLALAAACDRKPAVKETSTLAKPVPARAIAAGRVAEIVFVGQKEACNCTRDRIDKMWGRLESVLVSGPKVKVERIDLDVDEKRYNELDDKRSLVVPPGIYLLDARGKVVELLQGEVEEYQIAGALQ